MSKLTVAFLFQALLGLTVVTAARADDKADKKPAAAAEPVDMPWEKACEADLKKHCIGYKDDVRQCLADNEKDLSKDCTRHFSVAGYRVAKLCGPDIERLCQKEAEQNKLPQCMQAKQAQLSAKCRDALTPKKPADPAAAEAAPAPKKKGKKK